MEAVQVQSVSPRSISFAAALPLALAGFSIALLGLATTAAATNVGGTISVDTTWTLAGSPYVVTSDVHVQGTSGADGVTTLTIEPGVEVRFQQSRSLYVGSNSASLPGALVADGTSANPIVFTSDQTTKTRGHWNYVYFYRYANAAISLIDNAVVEYGGASAGNVYLYQASPTITNSIFRESASAGLYTNDASPALTSNTFTSNSGHGAYAYSGSPSFTSNTFSSNGQYGLYTDYGRPSLVSNSFNANGQRPVRFNPDVAFTGNTFQASVIREIELLGTTIGRDQTLPRHTDTDTGNPLPYVVLGSLNVQGTAGGDGVTTLTIQPGVEMRFNSGTALYVASNSQNNPGALDARGTAASKIVFTSNQVTKTRGFWSGIYFYDYTSDAGSALENVTVEYGGGGPANVYIYYASPKIHDSLIRESGDDGIYVYSGDVKIAKTTVKGNANHGVYLYYYNGVARFVDGALEANGLYGLYAEGGTQRVDVTGTLIKGNAQRPLRIHPNSVFTGNTYDGNTIQEIEFLGGTQTIDQRLPLLTDATSGVPVQFVYTGSLTIQGTDGADGVTTLTIDPGVTVLMDQNVAFTIGSNNQNYPGALNAVGTAESPILITSHQTTKTKGFWSGLYFYDYSADAKNVLKNVTIEYGGQGGTGSYMTYLYYSQPTFDDVTLRQSAGQGMRLWAAASPVLRKVSFEDNGGHGLYVDAGSNPVIHNSKFLRNGLYGLYTDSGVPVVKDSEFRNNNQRPLRVHPHSTITGLTFDGNVLQEIEFTGGTQSLDQRLVRYTDAVTGAPLAYAYTNPVTIQGTDGLDGVTGLTVDPGVTVKMDQSVQISIGSTNAAFPGKLVADGTAASPILFTARATTPTAGWWHHLVFHDDAFARDSILRNVTIEYAGRSSSYALYYYQSEPVMQDCTIRRNQGHGLYLYQSNPAISSCTFESNTRHGIYAYVGSPKVTASTFRDNGEYGLFTNTGQPDVTNSVLTLNRQRPLRIAPDSIITGNTYDQNTIQEIEFNGGTHTDDKTLLRILDATTGAVLNFVYTGSVTVQGTDGSDGVTTLTVDPGVTVLFDQYVQMTIAGNSVSTPGALSAAGTAALPIKFSSHQSGTKTAGWWGGLTLYDYADESVTRLQNVTIEYGGSSSGGVYLYRYSGLVRDCTINNNANHGIYVYDGSPTILNCTIRDNAAHGIYLYSSGTPKIRANAFRANAQYGVYTYSGGLPDVTDNSFVLNRQRPMRVAPDSEVAGNVFDRNSIQEIEFVSGTHSLDKTLLRYTDVTSGAPLTWVYTGTSYVQGTDGSDGVTVLTVEPGVTVAFDQGVSLSIAGNSAAYPGALYAAGTSTNPILFTSRQSTKTNGWWGNLQFNDYAEESLTSLQHATIEFGGSSTAQLYFYRFSPELSGCTVRKSGTHGVYLYQSNAVFDGCSFLDNNAHGVYAYISDGAVKNGLVKGNAQYGVYTQSGETDVTGNTIQLNRQRPLRLHPMADFSGNTYRSNTIQEIEFNGGTITSDQTLAKINDADTSALLRYAYTGSISVQGTDGGDGVTTLTVDPGVTVVFAPNTQATFGGSVSNPGALHAVGTPAGRITFTSQRTSPLAGDWYGLSFSNANAISTLDYVDVGYAGGSTAGVYISNSDVRMTNSHVFRSATYGVYLNNNVGLVFANNELSRNVRGLHVQSGRDNTIEGNRIHNNSFGVYVESSATANTFLSNRVVDNTNRGMYIRGSNSLIYNNLFRQSVNAEDRGSGNLWNATKAVADPLANIIGGEFFGGNRWSNYTGLDRDYDGLGDTLVPHRTIGAGRDNRPLTLPSEVIPDDLPPVTTISLSGTLGNAGWYRSAMRVTLSVVDDSSGVKATYYKLDSGQQRTYTGPFDLVGDGNRQITYWSVDNAKNTEASKTASAKIDATPPTTTVTLDGTPLAGGWYESAVTVTLSASDGMSGLSATEYRVDGATLWSTYNNPFVVSAEGLHTVEVRSRDVAGNQEAPAVTDVKIDIHPPTTTLGLTGTQGENGWWRSAVTATLTATDAGAGVDRTDYRLNAGSWTKYLNAVGVSGEGTHGLDYYSSDLVGHVEATKSSSIKIDTVAPVTTRTLAGTAGLAGWWRSPVTVTLTATDATSGVAATSYSLDGVTTQASGTTITTDLDHAFSYWSKDVAGNAETQRSERIKIDQTPPVTTATLLGTVGNNGWYRSAVTVDFAATDATSGVAATKYQLDGGAILTFSGAFSVTTDGLHTVEYWSTDVAGNVEAHHVRTIRIDTLPPVTTFSNGAPSWTDGTGFYVTSATDLRLSATDATSGVASTLYQIVGGGATPETDANARPLLSPGPGLGANGLPLPPAWTRGERTLEHGGVGTAAYGPYTAPFRLLGADGTRTISFYSDDVAGNVESTQTRVAKLDNTPPNVDVARPRIGSLSAFQAYVETDSDWDYFPDLVEQTAGTNAYDDKRKPDVLGVGSVAKPTPEVENVHQALKYAYVVAGTLVPITAPATDPLAGGVASGMDRVEFYLDGELLGVDTVAPFGLDWDTASLTLGNHTLTVKAYDHLGNARSKNVPIFGISLARSSESAPADWLAPFVPTTPQAVQAVLDLALANKGVSVAQPSAVQVSGREFEALLDALKSGAGVGVAVAVPK